MKELYLNTEKGKQEISQLSEATDHLFSVRFYLYGWSMVTFCSE